MVHSMSAIYIRAQWACDKRQDLLEASERYPEAQGHRLNRGYQDALEDPGETEDTDRV